MSKHPIRRTVILAAGVAAAGQIARKRARPALAGAADGASRRLRYWSGRLQGVSYRLRRHHPEPEVPDHVIADRVRSALGRLEKRLDIPRVHVYVTDHIAHIHGEMPSLADANLIERAAAGVSGVHGTETYMHIGPIPHDQRPSGGAAHASPSEARKQLVTAAEEAGAPAEIALRVVRATLGFLADRVPADEYDQFVSHLPDDVRTLCGRPARHGVRAKTVRTVPQLIARLGPATDPMTPENAEVVVAAVLGTLRHLVPEEDHDIAAVLPADLKGFWLASTP